MSKPIERKPKIEFVRANAGFHKNSLVKPETTVVSIKNYCGK